jgi:hypothetical protein
VKDELSGTAVSVEHTFAALKSAAICETWSSRAARARRAAVKSEATPWRRSSRAELRSSSASAAFCPALRGCDTGCWKSDNPCVMHVARGTGTRGRRGAATKGGDCATLLGSQMRGTHAPDSTRRHGQRRLQLLHRHHRFRRRASWRARPRGGCAHLGRRLPRAPFCALRRAAAPAAERVAHGAPGGGATAAERGRRGQLLSARSGRRCRHRRSRAEGQGVEVHKRALGRGSLMRRGVWQSMLFAKGHVSTSLRLEDYDWMSGSLTEVQAHFTLQQPEQPPWWHA